VFVVTHYLQILVSVVILYTIDMVDVLVRLQEPPQSPFNHKAMFVDPSAINSFWMTRLINHDVAVLIQPSTTSIVLTFKRTLDP
jgi:hypothetical protein